MKTHSSISWYLFVTLVFVVPSKRVGAQAPISVQYHAAYPQSMVEVHDAYLSAVKEMKLKVVSDESGKIIARSKRRKKYATVTIKFGPADTLVTDVKINMDYYYRPKDFQHYPFKFSSFVYKRLSWGDTSRYVYPQLIHPANARECKAKKITDWDHTKPIELIGGMHGLKERISYTQTARQHEVEGQIFVSAVVDADGNVNCAAVLSGLPDGLSEVALGAVLGSRFKPATYKGKKIPMKITLPITFRIKEF